MDEVTNDPKLRFQIFVRPRKIIPDSQSFLTHSISFRQTAVGGGFFLGFLAGFTIKRLIRLAAVIIGIFIAALARGVSYVRGHFLE